MTEQEKEIIRLHKELYDYLLGIHKSKSSFRFRVRRMNNQNRLAKGYYFNGNLKYLETSFWDYKDNLHQTPVIRLVYSFENKDWLCELIGRDSNERASYFRKMATQLGFSSDDRTPIWKKILEKSDNFLNPIQNFISNEKIKIDKYLNDNKFNENLIGFIKELDFNKDINRIENAHNYKQLEDKGKITLPNALTGIAIDKFIGGKQLSLGVDIDEPIPKNTQWIFFTGENGFGKTSILKAIATGLIEDNKKGIDVYGFKEGLDYSNSLEDNLDYEPMVKVVGYGVSRFMLTEQNADNQDVNPKTASLFSDYAKLISIEKALKDTFLEQEAEKKAGYAVSTFTSIINIFKIIIPKLTIRVERFEKETIDRRWQVRYYENDDNGVIFKDENGKDIAVELSNLAAGYKGMLTMIGDMMIHLTNNFKDSPKDISGIALIDEFDAHLHPKYQYELPMYLSEAFPNVQFIVSTHSPIPLLGLPKNATCVVYKVNRTANDGITVDRVDDEVPFRHLLPNSLLSSPIFGFEDIFPRDNKASEVITFDNWKDIEDTINLQKELQKLREEDLL